MEILFGVFLLIARLVFILWDSRRINSGVIARNDLRKLRDSRFNRKPDRIYLSIGFSLFTGLFALAEWLSPQMPPFAGRMSWLKSILYEAVGMYGMAAAATCASISLAVSAWSMRRKT